MRGTAFAIMFIAACFVAGWGAHALREYFGRS